MGKDLSPWSAALHNSHNRLAGLAAGLDAVGAQQPSKCSEWSIAQVYSHLGSGAEIFGLFLEAGLEGGEPPDRDEFPKIWDRWNRRSPEEQTADGVAADEAFLGRLDGAGAEALDALHLDIFGMEVDAATLLRMRLGEHAVHTWDVANALDPSATVAADAVDLLVDALAQTAGRAGKPIEGGPRLAVETTAPDRAFVLDTSAVSLTESAGEGTSGRLRLPAEVLLRVVYGRSGADDDESIEIEADGFSVDDLRAIFPGF